VGQLFQPGGAGYFVPTVHSLPPAPASGYYAPQQMRASSRWSQPMPRPPMIPGSGSGLYHACCLILQSEQLSHFTVIITGLIATSYRQSENTAAFYKIMTQPGYFCPQMAKIASVSILPTGFPHILSRLISHKTVDSCEALTGKISAVYDIRCHQYLLNKTQDSFLDKSYIRSVI